MDRRHFATAPSNGSSAAENGDLKTSTRCPRLAYFLQDIPFNDWHFVEKVRTAQLLIGVVSMTQSDIQNRFLLNFRVTMNDFVYYGNEIDSEDSLEFSSTCKNQSILNGQEHYLDSLSITVVIQKQKFKIR